MVKILIADDQQLIRESLKIILDTNPDFKVISLVSNGAEVLTYIEQEKPDVILMDVRMPQMDGVETTKIVKEKYPEIKVIILTTFDDDEYIYHAIKYGASGYLLKGCSLEELSRAICSVLQGGAMFNPGVAAKMAKFFSQMANHSSPVENVVDASLPFNETEWKIIEQVGNGFSNKEIASSLKFSEGTIRNYLSTILDKLELRDRTQLAIWYVSRYK